MVGDLDRFKSLNDRYGHRSGDQALQSFAALCRAQLRGMDFVSRVGGEEFAVVLPNTDAHGAVLAAERLRRATRRQLRSPGGAPITASFGVSSFPEHGEDAEALLDRADQAMYAAKRTGRDRTILFGPSLPTEHQSNSEREQLEAVLLLAETLDLRDAGTRSHSDTVASLSEQIARNLGLPSGRVHRIRLAGLLHDVGKIGIPDDILRKPGKLSPAEWAEMRKHPELGARIVAGAGLRDVAEWVLAHHERPDGHGYPHNLTAEQIPLEAKILSVADAYEAMIADRPYRKAPGAEFAREQLLSGAGTQFDSKVVAAFLGVSSVSAAD